MRYWVRPEGGGGSMNSFLRHLFLRGLGHSKTCFFELYRSNACVLKQTVMKNIALSSEIVEKSSTFPNSNDFPHCNLHREFERNQGFSSNFQLL